MDVPATILYPRPQCHLNGANIAICIMLPEWWFSIFLKIYITIVLLAMVHNKGANTCYFAELVL